MFYTWKWNMNLIKEYNSNFYDLFYETLKLHKLRETDTTHKVGELLGQSFVVPHYHMMSYWIEVFTTRDSDKASQTHLSIRFLPREGEKKDRDTPWKIKCCKDEHTWEKDWTLFFWQLIYITLTTKLWSFFTVWTSPYSILFVHWIPNKAEVI